MENLKPTSFLRVPEHLQNIVQYAVPVVGDCLNDDAAPLRICDGDIIAVHDVVFRDAIDLLPYINKTLHLTLEISGREVHIVKVLKYIDGINRSIYVQFYQPQKTMLQILFSEIRRLGVVDAVLSKGEWITA